MYSLTVSLFLFTGLESLPTELQRNFTLMRDLDTRSQGDDILVINKCFEYKFESLLYCFGCIGICINK